MKNRASGVVDALEAEVDLRAMSLELAWEKPPPSWAMVFWKLKLRTS